MTIADTSNAFLNDHTRISSAESFTFRCHPQVRCFNACCSKLHLVLTPYDIYRLHVGLGISTNDVLKEFTDLVLADDTGMPCFRLRMLNTREGSCPFVRESGCSVYENRPGACRAYPLGRAARIDTRGKHEERFFLVEEAHCKGFAELSSWTPAQWMLNQGLGLYNESNDKYMRLMTMQQDAPEKVPAVKLGMLTMALYNVDGFQKFIARMSLLDRLDMDDDRKQAILHDEEQTLLFGFAWAEMILFGSSADLTLRQ
ncbi:MAG: YkgJ family cysteine cluster protein [Desulfoplanes sp.]|nr:YkgJ family cysteine cluster protein [Desulfoplanes sp.]